MSYDLLGKIGDFGTKAYKKIGSGLEKVVHPQDWKSDEWRTAGAVLLGGYTINKYGVPGTDGYGKGFFTKKVSDPIANYFDLGDSSISNTNLNSAGLGSKEATINDLYAAKINALNKTTPWYTSPASGAAITTAGALYGDKLSSEAEAKATAQAQAYQKELIAQAQEYKTAATKQEQEYQTGVTKQEQDYKTETARQNAQRTAIFDLASKGYAQDLVNNQNKFLYGNAYTPTNPYTNSKVEFDSNGDMSIVHTGNTEGLASVGSTGQKLDYYDMGYMGAKAKADKDLAVYLQNLRNKPAIISANAAMKNANTAANDLNHRTTFTNDAYSNVNFGV